MQEATRIKANELLDQFEIADEQHPQGSLESLGRTFVNLGQRINSGEVTTEVTPSQFVAVWDERYGKDYTVIDAVEDAAVENLI